MSVERRLDELAGRWRLTGAQRDRLRLLLRLLAEDPHAPSAVTEPSRAVDVHVADSLNGLALPRVRAARSIADLGSGAGFPGLVLAIALPEAEVALAESNARKAGFIEHAIAELGLGNARTVCVRAEEWGAGREAHDLVTARALAPLTVVCEYAAPLLVVGGALVAWGGRRDEAGEAAADRAAALLGLGFGEVVRADPYPGGDDHHLHTFVKLEPTPSRFPRRAGVARKRPLGGAGRPIEGSGRG